MGLLNAGRNVVWGGCERRERLSWLWVAVLPFLVCAAAGDDQGKSKWRTTLSAGLDMTAGNTETTLGTVRIATEKTGGQHLLRLGVQGAYGRTQVAEAEGKKVDETTTQNADAFFNCKRKVDGAFAYFDVTLLHDRIAQVDYRVVPGVGVGRFLRDGPALQISVEAGVGYLWEEVDQRRDRYPTLRAAERIEWTISETANAWQSAEFVPKASDLANFLANAEAGIETKINATMGLRVVVQDKYDSEPAEAKERNDLRVIAGLSWKL